MAPTKRKGGVATAKPITATVAGTDYELIPTINAVRAINAGFGGLKPALEAVRNLNYDAVAQVIAAGSREAMKTAEIHALGEAIWKDDDRGEAMGAAVDFLVCLLNGGKPLNGDPEPETDAGN